MYRKCYPLSYESEDDDVAATNSLTDDEDSNYDDECMSHQHSEECDNATTTKSK